MARVLTKFVAALLIAIATALLSLPVVAFIANVHPSTLISRLFQSLVLDALRLSLLTSLSATMAVVILGTPFAYLLATRNFVGKRILETLLDLPIVLPPTVAGFALLLAFGRAGLLGSTLSVFGLHLPFTTLGVVLAQTFMSIPFFVTSARVGFSGVDRSLIDAAKTLGASEVRRFFRVLLPLSMPSLAAGVAMSCARALGEFGATITFAGNMPRVTQTMPLAVYVALQSDVEAALALSFLLMILSFTLLFILRSSSLSTRRYP